MSRKSGGTVLYYLYNGHGDVTALTDDLGNVKASYYYDAFGNILEETGGAFAFGNSYRYSGYQYDKESDLYYLNARYYSAKIARFMSQDTYTGQSKDPLSLNLYTYCFNNPIRYWDPTGHVVSETDKKNLTDTQQAAVQKATNDWKAANDAYKSAATKAQKDAASAAMAKANADANAIRASAGYFGGSNGQTITSINPGSGVKVKDVVSNASSNWKAGTTSGASTIGNLKEGEDYYIYDNTSYFFNNVRTIMESAGATVQYNKDTISIIPSPNRPPTSSALVNSILYSNKPLVSGKDFYIGWDGKAHFVDSSFGIAPVAIKPGGLKTEVKSKLSRDYLEESEIDTWLVFATGTNSNIDPVLAMRLAAYARDKDITITITSAYRSNARQIEIYIERGGYQDENGDWKGIDPKKVAPPGSSWHEYGEAVDAPTLNAVSGTDLIEYGLIKPLSNEPWHVQPIETRSFSQDKQSYLDAYNK